MKPKYLATVAASIVPFQEIQEAMRKFKSEFDIDVAVGAQLDTIGIWVGVNRTIPIPITGTYFRWGGTKAEGWGSGKWKGLGDASFGFDTLPDSLYRALIRAKIFANSWRGDIPGAYEIINAAMQIDGAVKIIDNQNMTMTVRIQAGVLPAAKQAMITQGILPIKPAGVTAIFEVV